MSELERAAERLQRARDEYQRPGSGIQEYIRYLEARGEYFAIENQILRRKAARPVPVSTARPRRGDRHNAEIIVGPWAGQESR